MIFKELIQQKWVQLVGCTLLGITVGVVFYPQSHIEERVKEKIKQEYTLKEEASNKQHTQVVQELTDKLQTIERSYRTFQTETYSKIQSLTTENTKLKQSSSKKKFRIVKPDGTIIEREFEESSSESSQTIIAEVQKEFDEKVKIVEEKWKKIHEERVSKLKAEYEAELKKAKSETKVVETTKEKEKIVDKNTHKLRPEVGITTRKDLYAHASYSLWGPVFLGGGISGTKDHFGEGRFGVGLEF